MPLPPMPYAITREATGILIEWDTAGHAWLYPARELRLACPCAACVEEMSGRRLLQPDAIPPDIRPETLSLVGAYGLRIRWSDGHDTGIYTYALLRGLCRCPACRPAGAGQAVPPRVS